MVREAITSWGRHAEWEGAGNVYTRSRGMSQCILPPPHHAWTANSTHATVHQSPSRSTLLIPPPQGFEGGATTFYMPSGTPGVLDARGVAPRTGCVLVFPHGDTMGSLVHEGSAVVSGAKYVIRTEVLYKLPPPKERGGGMQQQQHQQPAAQQRP